MMDRYRLSGNSTPSTITSVRSSARSSIAGLDEASAAPPTSTGNGVDVSTARATLARLRERVNASLSAINHGGDLSGLLGVSLREREADAIYGYELSGDDARAQAELDASLASLAGVGRPRVTYAAAAPVSSPSALVAALSREAAPPSAPAPRAASLGGLRDGISAALAALPATWELERAGASLAAVTRTLSRGVLQSTPDVRPPPPPCYMQSPQIERGDVDSDAAVGARALAALEDRVTLLFATLRDAERRALAVAESAVASSQVRASGTSPSHSRSGGGAALSRSAALGDTSAASRGALNNAAPVLTALTGSWDEPSVERSFNHSTNISMSACGVGAAAAGARSRDDATTLSSSPSQPPRPPQSMSWMGGQPSSLVSSSRASAEWLAGNASPRNARVAAQRAADEQRSSARAAASMPRAAVRLRALAAPPPWRGVRHRAWEPETWARDVSVDGVAAARAHAENVRFGVRTAWQVARRP